MSVSIYLMCKRLNESRKMEEIEVEWWEKKERTCKNKRMNISERKKGKNRRKKLAKLLIMSITSH